MKTLSYPLTVVALLAFSWPCLAQVTVAPRSREVTPPSNGANNTPVIEDGLVVYHKQAFLVRHGRAAMINKALVPDGQILTWEGKLVALPSGFSPYSNAAPESAGILVFGGKPFWLSQGKAALIDEGVVPEGKVLTAEGRLVPLPADFSGFTLENAPGVPQPLSTELGVALAPRAAGEIPISAAKPAEAEPVQWMLPVGAVSPVSGIRTYPGETAAALTNGATRTPGTRAAAAPPGSTVAPTTYGGKQDHGTKAVTVGSPP